MNAIKNFLKPTRGVWVIFIIILGFIISASILYNAALQSTASNFDVFLSLELIALPYIDILGITPPFACPAAEGYPCPNKPPDFLVDITLILTELIFAWVIAVFISKKVMFRK